MSEMAWTPTKISFSIVVVGVIEWRIQHPVWFEKIGVLSEEQSRAAVATFAPTPISSEFQTSEFLVRSEPGRWVIHTPDESNWTRIINVARIVFDSALNETQIGAYGVNTHADLSVSASSKIAAELADKFGLPRLGKERRGQFSYRNDREDHSITVTTHPQGDDYVLTYNVHHPLPPEKEGKITSFSLADHLDRNAPKDWRAGIDFAKEFSLHHNVNSEVK